MSEYYKDISKYFLDELKNVFRNIMIVCDDRLHISFIANGHKSRQINIYRLTSIDDIDTSIKLICSDLALVYWSAYSNVKKKVNLYYLLFLFCHLVYNFSFIFNLYFFLWKFNI
jgi:hypothetical protein